MDLIEGACTASKNKLGLCKNEALGSAARWRLGWPPEKYQEYKAINEAWMDAPLPARCELHAQWLLDRMKQRPEAGLSSVGHGIALQGVHVLANENASRRIRPARRPRPVRSRRVYAKWRRAHEPPRQRSRCARRSARRRRGQTRQGARSVRRRRGRSRAVDASDAAWRSAEIAVAAARSEHEQSCALPRMPAEARVPLLMPKPSGPSPRPRTHSPLPASASASRRRN
jgi:hypothetical protein